MSEEHDSWFKDAFGVDLGQSLSKIKDEVSTAVSSAASTVTQAVQTVEGAVEGTVGGAAAAASGAIKKVTQAFTPGSTSGPMQSDCKPVRGQVPGPAEHVLCGTHGHILDLNAKQIIAASLSDYKAGRMSGGIGASGVLSSMLPGLPGGGLGLPEIPGFPGGGGTGPFPKIPGDGSFRGFGSNPAPGAGTSGEPASGIAKAVGEVGEIAMEGIALFDAVVIGGLVIVGAGVIVGLAVEVKSSEDIAALPGDVDRVTGTMVAGYRAAIQNGPQPGDDAGKAGWLLGNDIASKMRSKLKEKNPETTDEQIATAIAASADTGAEAARPILRKKAQESVWISYASAHQDSRWRSYLNERFRAWSNIFGSAPRGEKLWTDYLNEYSNTASPLAGFGGDKDPRQAPGAPNGGPAIDPKTGQPFKTPGAPGVQPSSDPDQPDPAVDPKTRDDEPLEFTADKLPPTADEFFERVKKSKTPVVFRNLSLEVMKTLKAKYGYDLAFGLQQMGTIGSYAAWQIVVANCGNDFHAHHIVEQKVLQHLGYPVDQCPAVILTAAEHIEVSKILAIELPPGDISDLKRKEILKGYEKAYKNHPEWMSEVRRYFR